MAHRSEDADPKRQDAARNKRYDGNFVPVDGAPHGGHEQSVAGAAEAGHSTAIDASAASVETPQRVTGGRRPSGLPVERSGEGDSSAA